MTRLSAYIAGHCAGVLPLVPGQGTLAARPPAPQAEEAAASPPAQVPGPEEPAQAE